MRIEGREALESPVNWIKTLFISFESKVGFSQ